MLYRKIDPLCRGCFSGEELFGIFPGIGIAGVDDMERMGLGQALDGEGADAVVPGDYGAVQKADADAGGCQRLDGNEAADGHLSREVVQAVSGGREPFLENAAGAGALLPDDDGLIQQLSDGNLPASQGAVLGADAHKGLLAQQVGIVLGFAEGSLNDREIQPVFVQHLQQVLRVVHD